MDGMGRILKDERISNALNGDQGGTLLIADTKAQVLKACKGEMTFSSISLFLAAILKNLPMDLNSYRKIQGKNSWRKICFGCR
jgi:hypothetical protein